ncbi:MAG: UDP-N-acetylmuramate dehydrogenase [Hyphomicrobiales bacterium]
MGAGLIEKLPPVRGRLRENVSMADLTWFRVGGPADVVFTPADEEDLAEFLAALPQEIPVYPVGVGSNLLVRDGGIEGVVVRLGRDFGGIEVEDGFRLRVGAAVPDVKVAHAALQAGIKGLTFLRGIPGTIGGALRMNGGAYERETKDVLIEARAVDRKGKVHVLSVAEMNYSYRHCGAPEGLIFTQALLQGEKGDPTEIEKAMKAVTDARERAQPVRSRTGGSTFKNPSGAKAWQLIDDAGMRGYMVGNAQVSEKHCNFLINQGGATAMDIETLGETVRTKVKEDSGVELSWEIKRIGRKV